MCDPRFEEDVDRNLQDRASASTQDGPHGDTDRHERLADRLACTTSFADSHREWLRVQELAKSRPDYGTFLKDEELKELFPEAAADFHVDDVRRGVMMIRMILDYGEAAFTADEGDAVHTLLWCILGEAEICLDGTWSTNNPAARKRRIRSTPMPSLDFGDDDDDDILS
jgi:hypothetical protein